MAKKQEREAPSKRQVLREQRQKKQRQQRIFLVAGLILVTLVVLGVIIVPSIQQANSPAGEIVTVTSNPRPQTEANHMGDPNAPVKMDEYSDFQCPYCKKFADETENQIVETYVKTGKVYFTFHSMGNWVSNNMGQGKFESRDAAEAAYCAGDQNKFWEYKDMLFANWQGEDVGSFTDKRLMAFAETLKLDMNQFRSCYEGKKYRSAVENDLLEGRRAGVDGTPSFVINGKLVKGAVPFADFQKEIEAALASK